jgi:hypothetical protein
MTILKIDNYENTYALSSTLYFTFSFVTSHSAVRKMIFRFASMCQVGIDEELAVVADAVLRLCYSLGVYVWMCETTKMLSRGTACYTTNAE